MNIMFEAMSCFIERTLIKITPASTNLSFCFHFPVIHSEFVVHIGYCVDCDISNNSSVMTEMSGSEATLHIVS